MRVFIQLFLISVLSVSCAHNSHIDELSRRANYESRKENKRTKAKPLKSIFFPMRCPMVIALREE